MTIPLSPRRHGCISLLFLFLLLGSLAACSEQEQEAQAPAEDSPAPGDENARPTKRKNVPDVVTPARKPPLMGEVPFPEMTAPDIGAERPAESGQDDTAALAPIPFEEYSVVLGADEQLRIPGPPGELRVWIGGPDSEPDFPSHMANDETTVPAVGDSARVTPFAPAFDIEPARTQCIRIHPRGSEVRFQLIPKRAGAFDVGADVELFDSRDCSGAPVPRSAATLQVRVEVDRMEIILDRMTELWEVFWEKLLAFWGGLLALLFGLLLFLLRGKLKRWFGYDQHQD